MRHTTTILAALALSLFACGGSGGSSTQGTGAGSTSTTTGATTGSTTGTGGSTTGTGGSATSAGGSTTGTGGSGGSGGAVCGGLKGLPCAVDEWCDFPNDDCGADDGTGLCVKRPLDCSGPQPAPTCGCDGQSYSNPCFAMLAGTDVHAGSSCMQPKPFACGPSLSCKADQEYCEVSEGFTVDYHCHPLPASCLPPNQAVCGCMPTPADCGSCSGIAGQVTETHGCG